MPRLTRCVLVDPDHKLPMPDRGMRLFRAGGETVDLEDPFWMGLVGDGSIRPETRKDRQADKPPAGSRRKTAASSGDPADAEKGSATDKTT